MLKIPGEVEIDIDTVEDRAQVVHHSKYCEPGHHWCWRQEYDLDQQQYNPTELKRQKTVTSAVDEMFTGAVFLPTLSLPVFHFSTRSFVR